MAGSTLGLAAALSGLGVSFGPGGGGMPDNVAALVAGREITRADVDRIVSAMASERGEKPGDRSRVVERLVDEQLLVARALDLGLADRDPRIRGDLVQGVISSVVAPYEDAQPGETDLREFFDKNRDLFANPPRLRVAQVFVSSHRRSAEQALARAGQAVARLQDGERVEEVAASLGDPSGLVLPDAFLMPAKLRDYLGPTSARTLLGMEPGAISEPVRVSGGYRVLVLLGREEPRPPSLDGLRDEVLATYRRRLGEEALERYLAELRRSYEVRVFDSRTSK